MTTIVAVELGGTGANNTADARAALGVASSTVSNAAYSQANSAYAQANLAYAQANTATTNAGNAHNQANAAYGQANLAYTAANNAVLRAGDTMTGQLNISTGGLLVTGNVGIGNSSPTHKLHVQGDVRATNFVGSNNSYYLYPEGTSFLKSVYFSENNTSTGYVQIGENYVYGSDAVTGGSFELRNNGNSFINSGNVGIGVTSPISKLHVQSNTNIRAVIRNSTENTSYSSSWDFMTGTGSFASTNIVGRIVGLITQADPSALQSALAFHTNSGDSVGERLRIDANGNVGIGTASPTAKLHVYTTTNYTGNLTFDGVASIGPVLNIEASGNVYTEFRLGSWALTRAKLRVEGYSGAGSGTGGGTLSLWTGDTSGVQQQRVTIDGVGSVGIGTTSVGGFNGTFVLGGSGNPTSGYLEGIHSNQLIPSTVTTRYDGFLTSPSTAAASFTVPTIRHYAAQQGTFNSPSVVTSQYGFAADANLTGATNNFGFYSDIAAASNRWNFYANGTARNYFAGNTSIGTTSEGGRLNYSGSFNAGATGSYPSLLGYGSYGGGIGFADTAYAGIYTQDAGQSLMFFTGQTASDTAASKVKMKIDTNGNVGIGTSSPAGILHVRSTSGYPAFLFEAANTAIYAGPYLNLRNPSLSTNFGETSIQHVLFDPNDLTNVVFQIQQRTTNSSFIRQILQYDYKNQHWQFFTNGSERIRITSAGSVGIGTTSPGRPLTVYSASADNHITVGNNAPSISLTNDPTNPNGATQTYIMALATSAGNYSIGSGDFLIGGVGNSRGNVIINSNYSGTGTKNVVLQPSAGNVGVGTSSPGGKFVVQDGISHTSGVPTYRGSMILTNGGGNTTSSGGFEFHASTYQNGFGWRLSTPDLGQGSTPLVFQSRTDSVSWTEVMRLDNLNSRVGIGTSSPAYKLDVNGTARATFLYGLAAGSDDSANFGNTQSNIRIGGDGATVRMNASPWNLTLIAPSVIVSGALSKSSGSFKIDHPLPEKSNTHYLVHSFIEGPQADLIYRGSANLINGIATVNIDTAAGMTEGTFVLLCRDVQCFTSNETDWDAVRGSVTGNILTIECQNSSSNAIVSWMVIGERQDKHMLDTNWTDDAGKVIVEPEKT